MIFKNVFNNAQWITAKELSDNAQAINLFHREQKEFQVVLPEELKNLHIFFKKALILSQPAERIYIRITADDYYKLYINGKFVGQGPAQGYYFNYYWNEFDITDYLHKGENQIEADVYYQGLISRAYNSGDRRIGMIACIYSDSHCIAVTDESWQYAFSKAYTISHIFGYETQFAENFDSRKKELSWKNCCVRNTDYVFSCEPAKAVSVYLQKPSTVSKLQNNGILCDFGTEITAGLKISAVGKSGDKIKILCAEELDHKGNIKYNMRCNCRYEEYWTLDDGENYLQQYDYKAFRYAALIPEGAVKIKSVEATVRHYPFDDNHCRLITENKVLLKIWDMCKNTVKYCAQEVFVDCPTREKGQYAGDLTITSTVHTILTGDTSLFKKAVDNQMQSLKICPGLLAVTPGSHMQEIADYSLQFPILALQYFKYTGDTEYLRQNLKVCERIIEYFSQFAGKDGLIEDITDKWNLVDWPENMRDGYDFPIKNPIENGLGKHNVINAFYVGAVIQTERIKELLSISHNKKSTALIDAFNKEFFNEDTHLYTDRKRSTHSSIHSNILPVYYGFCPKDFEKNVTDFLMERKLKCSVYMSFFLLKALCFAGRYDDAFSLIVSQEENSWYNMIKEGATTCFETWSKKQKANTSLCHAWASSPIAILAEDILPNRPDIGRIIFK